MKDDPETFTTPKFKRHQEVFYMLNNKTPRKVRVAGVIISSHVGYTVDGLNNRIVESELFETAEDLCNYLLEKLKAMEPIGPFR